MSIRATSRKNAVSKPASDVIFDIVIYSIAILLVILTLYPMYFVVIASFSDPTYVATGETLLLPKGITLRGYQKLFEYDQLWTGYKNTILYVLAGTAFSLFVNIPAAYALSRKELYGRGLFTAFFLIPMFFTGGLVPTYLVVSKLGLINSFWVMVVPFSVVTYYIIVGRTFFVTSIPNELWEAAQLDGCGTLRFFLSIVLPLSKAIVSVIGLWAAVGLWNSYFNAMIYLQEEELQPLQLVLRNILINNQAMSTVETGQEAAEMKKIADLIKYGVIVISSLPIMMLYPFVQKYFNQGVMLGSVKG